MRKKSFYKFRTVKIMVIYNMKNGILLEIDIDFLGKILYYKYSHVLYFLATLF